VLDCLVIGGGPAGLTAAVYLGRFLRSVCVADAGSSRAALIPLSHNYPGFLGISGEELLHRLAKQAQMYGAHIIQEKITELKHEPGVFIAESGEGRFRARTVIIATGLVDKAPAMDDLNSAVRKGLVRYCPICDGLEAKDKRIGLIGDFEAVAKKALFLKTYSTQIMVFPSDTAPHRSSMVAELSSAGIGVYPEHPAGGGPCDARNPEWRHRRRRPLPSSRMRRAIGDRVKPWRQNQLYGQYHRR
jgi:thioredoxin reductase (NADPH)